MYDEKESVPGWTLWVAIALVGWLWLSPWSCDAAGKASRFEEIKGACRLVFPRDHGPHPGYRTEWWYYTGNVKSASGTAFGFQLTFFRVRPRPGESPERLDGRRSAWRTKQIFLAHAALTSVDRQRFYHRELAARQALHMAGALRRGERVDVFLRNWMLNLGPHRHHLQVTTPDFSYRFDLKPVKPPVLHGRQGYSRKGKEPESASCYYSFTRLAASGFITVSGKRWSVAGDAWMDHEFSSAPLEADLVGWDWFSLQFYGGRELMIYLLRNKNGEFTEASAGTFVDVDGTTIHLVRKDIAVDILDHWISPHTRGRYPSRWRLRIPPLGLDIEISPRVEDQEMQSPEQILPAYWEGSVAFSGAFDHGSAQGLGYAEMTGYARPFAPGR